MEVFMHAIPLTASEEDVHDHFKIILHDVPFKNLWDPGYLMSFSIRLHRIRRGKRGRTGVLGVPDRKVAQLLIQKAADRQLPPLHSGHIQMSESNTPIDPDEARRLHETPYQDPTLLRQQAQLEEALSSVVHISSLQFGWMDRDGMFSSEWSRSYSQDLNSNSSALIKFNAGSREVRIEEHSNVMHALFPRSDTYQPRHVVIRFGAVEGLAYYDRRDADPSMLFTLDSNPAFEQLPLSILNLGPLDYFQKRLRRQSMSCERHQVIVGYTSRAVLVTFKSISDLQIALEMAGIAHLPKHSTSSYISDSRGHFATEAILDVEAFAADLNWPVASKVLGLMQRLDISAKELIMLKPHIIQLEHQYRGEPELAADILDAFGYSVREVKVRSGENFTSRANNAIEQCFRRSTLDVGFQRRPLWKLSDDLILAYHLNVTPTSMQLQGPYPEQSNRVLRKYKTHQDRFLRVSFTDEDRLELRFNREVDGKEQIGQRVGGMLRKSLIIAGREFEFLAYSNSALKEHSVYFVAPFSDPIHGLVTAEHIRFHLGDFSNVKYCPARYGARMSQAFTSTNISITVEAEEIVSIPDITSKISETSIVNGVESKVIKTINFTDGVGTCSRQTMNSIADSLRFSGSQKRNRRRRSEFGAVQIRLGGSKGMISVDYTRSDSNTIYIRDSMMKFTSQSRDVEIADTFERPKLMYLNRPLIMILETLGVPITAFQRLQEKVIDFVTRAVESFESSARLLEGHGLGTAFRVPSVFLGLCHLDLDAYGPTDTSDLFADGMNVAVNHILRDLKHKARIPVEDSYTLVGVADVHGFLKEGEVFVCILHPDRRKEYIGGSVVITRSPAIHPGDVQIAHAIGRPPKGSPFEHEDLPNCVVFACQGRRSLPQSLGGGDLDGDLYNIILHHDLFPERTVEPAAYDPVKLRTLERPCTINDVADFVVDYFMNDHLGLIAIENLKIADGSALMSEDPRCIQLAELHSCAVDFQKSGIAADISSMPKAPLRRPDWSRGEIGGNNNAGFYESQRALGVLYRNVVLPSVRKRQKDRTALGQVYSPSHGLRPYELDPDLRDPISLAIIEELKSYYIFLNLNTDLANHSILPLFKHYAWRLQSICENHSLTSWPLTEEECLAGTISARTSQHRRRNDLQARLREQCTQLVDYIRDELKTDDLEEWLTRTWVAWRVSRREGGRAFGANTYGFIALGSMFEAFKAIKRRDEANDYDYDY